MSEFNQNAAGSYVQRALGGADPNLTVPARPWPVGSRLLDYTAAPLPIGYVCALLAGARVWTTEGSGGGGGGPPTGPAGGDLGGTYPNPTVVNLHIAGEAQGDIIYRNAVSWVRLPASTSGFILTTQGAGADLVWAVNAAVPTSRTLTGTDPVQIDGVNTPVDLSADRTISVLAAGAAQTGVTTAAAQTIGGTKTMNGGLIIPTGQTIAGGTDLALTSTTQITETVTGAGNTAQSTLEIGTPSASISASDGSTGATLLLDTTNSAQLRFALGGTSGELDITATSIQAGVNGAGGAFSAVNEQLASIISTVDNGAGLVGTTIVQTNKVETNVAGAAGASSDINQQLASITSTVDNGAGDIGTSILAFSSASTNITDGTATGEVIVQTNDIFIDVDNGVGGESYVEVQTATVEISSSTGGGSDYTLVDVHPTNFSTTSNNVAGDQASVTSGLFPAPDVLIRALLGAGGFSQLECAGVVSTWSAGGSGHAISLSIDPTTPSFTTSLDDGTNIGSVVQSSVSIVEAATSHAFAVKRGGTGTASACFYYGADVSGGSITVTLPTTPADGTTITIYDAKRQASVVNVITIAPGGGDVISFGTALGSPTIVTVGGSRTLMYDATEATWFVTAYVSV